MAHTIKHALTGTFLKTEDCERGKSKAFPLQAYGAQRVLEG
jgi:hypothetical protein